MPPIPGIFLIVDFDWPHQALREHGTEARLLHDVTQNKEWIRECAVASGGLAAGTSSTWVFWLENYAALDRLLRDPDDEVSQAYREFFVKMSAVVEKVRDEVLFPQNNNE